MGVRKNTMSTMNGSILTAEAEQKLLAPIDEYVGGIQGKINALRADGTDQVIALTNHIAITKENSNYTKGEKKNIIAQAKTDLVKAKEIEKRYVEEIGAVDPSYKLSFEAEEEISGIKSNIRVPVAADKWA